MSVCPEAEQYLKDKNITISARTRAVLASHPPAIQRKAVVNPFMHNIIQNCINMHLERFQKGGVRATSTSTTTKTTTQPTVEKKVEKEDSGMDEPIPNIFGGDDDY